MSNKNKEGVLGTVTTPEEAVAILKAESERKQRACAEEIKAVLDKYGMDFRCDPIITQDGRITVSGIQIVPKVQQK